MTALVATDRLEFAPPTTPGLLRALVLALLAHVFLLAALTWGVHWKSEEVNVTAEAELWSALPQQAATKLVELPPAPQPTPPPPEPKPVKVLTPLPPPPQAQPKLPDANIALEREKLRLKKEKDSQQELEKQRELAKLKLEKQRLEQSKQEKLLLEKKRRQDQHEQEIKAAQEKKKTDQAAQRKATLQAQQEAQKLEAQRRDNMKRMTGLAGASGAPDATGTALHASGPSASYAGRIRARIKPNIVFTDTIAGNPVAEVEVRTSPDGTIVGRKLTQASGIKSWDDAVLKAIDKTEVLPRDVDGRVPPVLTISFRPKD